jgi:hypothetical protein
LGTTDACARNQRDWARWLVACPGSWRAGASATEWGVGGVAVAARLYGVWALNGRRKGWGEN